MASEISPEKLRDMTRSILPSKNREPARKAKKRERRRVRRIVRVDVRRDDPRADPCREADQRENVQWRRAGDKLSHFMRWCHALTYGMPAADALAYVRRILPRNVIGDHAFGHWKTECELRHVHFLRFAEEKRRSVQSILDQTRHRLRRALELEPHLLGELNAEIKARKEPGKPRRLLHGIHDVDGFVEIALFGTPAEESCRHDHGFACTRKAERHALVEILAAVEIAHGPKRRVPRGISVYPY